MKDVVYTESILGSLSRILSGISPTMYQQWFGAEYLHGSGESGHDYSWPKGMELLAAALSWGQSSFRSKCDQK